MFFGLKNKSKSFESAEGIYTVAEVADAPPASKNVLKSMSVEFWIQY